MRGESQPECRECGGKGQESGDWCGCRDSLEAESLRGISVPKGTRAPPPNVITVTQAQESSASF